MAAVGVVHLVRHANGLAALERFLASYRTQPAGAEHDLVLVLKGFPGGLSAEYRLLLAGLSHRTLSLPDRGFDLEPYFRAAAELDYRWFCFLNSFSRPLVAGWLELLLRHAAAPGVGIVGATGSHQSVLSDAPQVIAEARPGEPAWRRPVMNALRRVRYATSIRGRFLPFPNPHIRTNAFAAAREVLLRVRCPRLYGKWAAYRFESGVDGVTRQITAAGLRALVVGADGNGYAPTEWSQARTFWIAGQENLLVSDNQTRAYAEGGPALRERLAYFAWRRYPDGTPRREPPAP